MAATENRLNLVELPVSLLDPNPWNPNRQSDAVARAERESIVRFGFIDPVTVRPYQEGDDGYDADRYQIVDGEHRWREATDLGEETVPCVILPITELEARKLTIVLNETRGEADVVELGKLLANLQTQLDADEFRLALPYSTSELEHLIALNEQIWDSFDADPLRDVSDADPDAGDELVELLLNYTVAQREQLDVWLKMIAKAEHADGISEAVYAAARVAALAVNQGAVPDPV